MGHGKKNNPNKRKRVTEMYEEIADRPWCYYCDRDFDDVAVLVGHQKAKHFQCVSGGCHRRLNTVGGLRVHMQQVHKEELHEVPNAMIGRTDLSLEIFGMMGVPEELTQKRRAAIMAVAHKEQVEHFKRTGNHLPGAVRAGEAPPPTQNVYETTESIVAKSKEAKRKLVYIKALRAAHTAAGKAFEAKDVIWPPPASVAGAIPSPDSSPSDPLSFDPFAPELLKSTAPPPSSSPGAADAAYTQPGQQPHGAVPNSSSSGSAQAQHAYLPQDQPYNGNGTSMAYGGAMQPTPSIMPPMDMHPMRQTMLPTGPAAMHMPHIPMQQMPLPASPINRPRGYPPSSSPGGYPMYRRGSASRPGSANGPTYRRGSASRPGSASGYPTYRPGSASGYPAYRRGSASRPGSANGSSLPTGPAAMHMPHIPMQQMPLPASPINRPRGYPPSSSPGGYPTYRPGSANGSSLPGLSGAAGLPRRPPQSSVSQQSATWKTPAGRPSPSITLQNPIWKSAPGTYSGYQQSAQVSPFGMSPYGMSPQQLDDLNRLMDAAEDSARASHEHPGKRTKMSDGQHAPDGPFNRNKFKAESAEDVAFARRSRLYEAPEPEPFPSLPKDMAQSRASRDYQPPEPEPLPHVPKDVEALRRSRYHEGPELEPIPFSPEDTLALQHRRYLIHDASEMPNYEPPSKSKKITLKKKVIDANKKYLLTDNEVSWEEKRSLAPRYSGGSAVDSGCSTR